MIPFIISFGAFMWLVTAWEFLNQLSWGRARRIESKDKDLSEIIEGWLETREAYDITFKVMIFSVIAIMSVSATKLSEELQLNFPGLGVTVTAVCVVLIALIAGEAIAKSILIRFDVFVLKFTIPVIKALRYSILYPVVIIIQTVQAGLERLNSDDGDDKTTAEDEIMSLVEKEDEEADDENALEEDERMMIKGIFGLDDTPVREIMMPRIDVHGLPMTTTPEEAKLEFIRTGHSRIPIYENNIDEIKGIIYAKDFLDDSKVKNETLMSMSHKPFFIPETKPVDDLLDEVKLNNTHIAVVIDEYGGTAGIVTLEDIIEEIVGEIHDEYDVEKDEDKEPQWMPDGSVIVSARTLINDVNELLHSDIAEDQDSDTIGGFVCELLGKIPVIGEEATVHENITAKVLNADKKRVISVSLRKVENNEE